MLNLALNLEDMRFAGSFTTANINQLLTPVFHIWITCFLKCKLKVEGVMLKPKIWKLAQERQQCSLRENFGIFLTQYLSQTVDEECVVTSVDDLLVRHRGSHQTQISDLPKHETGKKIMHYTLIFPPENPPPFFPSFSSCFMRRTEMAEIFPQQF